MELDWNTLIMTFLGGTSVLGLVQAVRYRKENKKLKENEVKLSSVEAQKQEIDLADMYKDKVLEMLEQVSVKQDSGSNGQKEILGKLGDLDKRVGDMDSRVFDIVTYLNGDYQDFLKRQHAKPRPRKK